MLKDINLSINQSETIVLLGSSGCGKTTLLRLINKLENPNEGDIFIDGESITRTAKEELRRSIGYVIQHTGLLPHLTIKENIELVGKIAGKEITNQKLMELLLLIGLEEVVLEQFPNELSGGQQQRIGIARALATDPEIILMDEPFSALDNITRGQLQDDFRNLKHLEDKTIILVTHDVQEAFKLADRIVLLEAGEVQQFGTPFDLLNRPANLKVDTFLKKDRFVLSLQTSTYNSASLFNFLNEGNVSIKEKEMAFKNFLQQMK